MIQESRTRALKKLGMVRCGTLREIVGSPWVLECFKPRLMNSKKTIYGVCWPKSFPCLRDRTRRKVQRHRARAVLHEKAGQLFRCARDRFPTPQHQQSGCFQADGFERISSLQQNKIGTAARGNAIAVQVEALA